ncbi:MAG TPA: tetratricopeptide repeat protein [Terriglobales bacterium]|nr:tetratricopeptide repeat protein [Terriglobales bacterium]
MAVCLAPAAAQMTPKATVDTSETIFTVLAAMNTCGYDQELSQSDPLRQQIRGELARAAVASPDAVTATRQICQFYTDHRQGDQSHDLAQYLSLALTLGPAPDFKPVMKEADLPPDAGYVLGLQPLLPSFYKSAGLHAIWERHQPQYEGLINQFHTPIAKLLNSTDLYLRLPIAGYMGRKFSIYLAPLGAPGQVNARNYGNDYYIVLTPARGTLQYNQIRHTYLHYVLDPIAMKRPTAMSHLEPLLPLVQTAPMDEVFKHDATLLTTECLIQAVEARTIPGKGKQVEEQRDQAVEAAMKQGYVLTRYFYDQLPKFEKEPAGLQDAFPNWLYDMDIDHEKKVARNIEFAGSAHPEVVRLAPPQPSLLDAAEKDLVSGNLAGAQQLAEQSLSEQKGEPGRAFFILARTATMKGDMAGAQKYFARTVEVSREPRLLAWSHIYLGRIFDLQDNRPAALDHYRTALNSGDLDPQVRAAAEKGLKEPYAPPGHAQ